MEPRLYLVRASRKVEGRAYAPKEEQRKEFSPYNLVIAKYPAQADEKFLSNLKHGQRLDQTWEISDNHELTAGKNISLEERVKIIEEVIEILGNNLPVIK